MEESRCKHCGSEQYVKNGIKRGKQNYLCKSCGRNFTIPRKNQDRAIEKRLAVILYGSRKASFRFLAKLFNVCPATVMNWVQAYGDGIEEPSISKDLKHTVTIECNNSNTRHYLGRFTRKTKIVSKSEDMVNLTLKIWWHLNECGHLQHNISSFLSSLT